MESQNPNIVVLDRPNDILTQTAKFADIAYDTGITDKNKQTQLGVHFEEVAEMVATLQFADIATAELVAKAFSSLNALASQLKNNPPLQYEITDRLEFLDSICDQLVTATLSAKLFGMDPVGGLEEVNRSNYSKLVDGKMLKDRHTAKWLKGPDYKQPDLTPFI